MMDIHTILAPLNGDDGDPATLAAGFSLCRGLQAHLEACFLRPEPSAQALMDGFLPMNPQAPRAAFEAMARKDGKRRAARSRALFEASRIDQDIPEAARPWERGGATAIWRERVGDPERMGAQTLQLHDLGVFARGPGGANAIKPSMMERLLLDSGRPLFIPGDAAQPCAPKRIMIAWDGRAPAVHAVWAATPFLMRAQTVRILTLVSPNDAQRADPRRLAEHLAWRGVKARAQVKTAPSRNAIGAMIAAEAERWPCDLLVAGAYAHYRLKEAIFGGATRRLLESASVPLLMMH